MFFIASVKKMMNLYDVRNEESVALFVSFG